MIFINRLTLVYNAEMRSKSIWSCFHTTFHFAVKKRLDKNKQSADDAKQWRKLICH